MEQLLLVTSCDSPAGIGASLRTHVCTYVRTYGWTDRRDVGNSILDCAPNFAKLPPPLFVVLAESQYIYP